jgi:hypothetical protein
MLRVQRRNSPSESFMMLALWMQWMRLRLFLRAYSKAKRVSQQSRASFRISD